jgi:tetrachlorobenzoquinone reductase
MASSDLNPADIAVRLSDIRYGASGINLYRFRSIDGRALPSFDPGAHIDVQICDEHRRQYSLIWPPDDSDSYTVAVQVSEAGRGGSRALHYESVVGRTYTLSVPRNNFALHEDGAHYALFAGGIGVTPIVSMYRKLKQAGASVTFWYWTANRDRTLFLDELSVDPDVHLMHDAGDGKPARRISEIIETLPMDTQLYCCGPGAMLTEFDHACETRPVELAHRERFSAAAETLPRDAFKVYLKRSDRTLTVRADQSLLQVCLDAGVDCSYSCEEGVCGACEVRVLAGEVEHRDSVLSPALRAQNTSMMMCCSRGIGSSLVLDI